MNDDLRPIGDETRRLERAQLKRLELASLAEATTLATLVCIAVPLKHVVGHAIATQILGPIHGIAFLFYIWTVLQTVTGGTWSSREILRLVASAFIPFAGFTTPFLLRPRLKALS